MPELTPLERLQAVVDDIPADEQRYHLRLVSDDPAMTDAVMEIQRWSRAAFGSAAGMQALPGVESIRLFGYAFEAADVAAHLSGRGALVRAVEEQIAVAGLERMWGATRRVAPLLERMVSLKLPPFASKYLFQAAQLYLWGFDPQVFPMARSALEAALKHKLSDKAVFRRLQIAHPRDRNGQLREPDLAQRIDALEAKPALIDDAIITTMHDIRIDGNQILHTVADLAVTRHGNTLDLLTALGSCLNAISAVRESP